MRLRLGEAGTVAHSVSSNDDNKLYVDLSCPRYARREMYNGRWRLVCLPDPYKQYLYSMPYLIIN